MKSDINVTPFIDVLLVLLIIFMVVAPAPPPAVDASLPEPGGAEPRRTRELVVDVEPDRFALNRNPIWNANELEERLREALEARSERWVFVRASGDVAYHRVMGALDAARGAGAERIGMLDPQVEVGEAGSVPPLPGTATERP